MQEPKPDTFTATPPTPDPDTALWAIRIADECMRDQVLCHGIPLGENTVGLVNSAAQEIEDLERADPALQEAFRWLSHRGLARLSRDQHGAMIVLTSGGNELPEAR